MKWRFGKRVAHEFTDVVIAWQAEDRQAERTQQSSKMVIRFGAVVLDQIACDDGDIGAPATREIVIEHGGQRRVSGRAAQRTVNIGKQVRVCQVQNP